MQQETHSVDDLIRGGKMHIRVCVHAHVRVHVHMHVHVHVHMCMCMCMYMYVAGDRLGVPRRGGAVRCTPASYARGARGYAW